MTRNLQSGTEAECAIEQLRDSSAIPRPQAKNPACPTRGSFLLYSGKYLLTFFESSPRKRRGFLLFSQPPSEQHHSSASRRRNDGGHQPAAECKQHSDVIADECAGNTH